jgi:hypothetical protein
VDELGWMEAGEFGIEGGEDAGDAAQDQAPRVSRQCSVSTCSTTEPPGAQRATM